MNIGPAEIAVIAVVLALLFGGGIAVGVIVAVSSLRRRNQVAGSTTDPALTDDNAPFPAVPDRNNASKPRATSGQVVLPPDAMDTSDLSDATRTEIGRLLADRQLIAAIKLVRESTGLGLREAKEYAERWRDHGALGNVDDDTTFGPTSFPAPPHGHRDTMPMTGPVILPPDSLDTTTIHDLDRLEIGKLLAEDKLIQAIKKVRESTGLGLKEAKDFAERWRDLGTATTLDSD